VGTGFALVVAFSLSVVLFLLLVRVWAAHEPPLQSLIGAVMTRKGAGKTGLAGKIST
jgi:hypothetical protein